VNGESHLHEERDCDFLRCDFLPESYMAPTPIRERLRMLRYQLFGDDNLGWETGLWHSGSNCQTSLGRRGDLVQLIAGRVQQE